jgi:hypothetical protein
MFAKLGEVGGKFFATKVEISTFSFCWACSVWDRLLVGEMSQGLAQRREDAKFFSLMPEKGG